MKQLLTVTRLLVAEAGLGPDLPPQDWVSPTAPVPGAQSTPETFRGLLCQPPCPSWVRSGPLLVTQHLCLVFHDLAKC